MDTCSPKPPPSPPPSPVDLVRVPFRGGYLLAALVDGAIVVPLRPVCDALGVSPQGQLTKLRGKPWVCIKMILSQMPGDDQVRQVVAVDLRSLPLWLATLEPSRVKPEAREALLAYQREAAEVLFRHFLTPVPPGLMAPAGDVTELSAEVAELSARVALQGEQLVTLRKALGQGQGPRRRRRRQRTPTGATSAALREVVQAEVLALVGQRPGLRGGRQARTLLRRRCDVVGAAIRALLKSARLQNRGTSQHPRLYLPASAGDLPRGEGRDAN